jgi:hypothetical protein
MTSGPTIDYDALQQDAMRGLVRAVLIETAKSGLPGEHHFYISFNTRAPGVGLSRRLKEKYPREMTIVLQHRFWGLLVSDDRFEVNLTFDGIPERLVIPFQAIRVFVDPSVRFGLQFEIADIGPEPLAPTQDAGSEDAANNGEARTSDAAAARPAAQRKPRPQKKARTADPVAEKDAHSHSAAAVEPPAQAARAAAPAPAKPALVSDTDAGEPQAATGAAKVVSLDAFRKR